MVRRSAFTFIELIFAIVIIAIAVVSLPMMKQVIFKGIDGAIVQEAVFAAATELNEVTTAHWDDNSFEPGSADTFARVIDHMGNCENNSSLPSYRYMPGQIVQPLHRKCLDSNLTTPADANVNGVVSLNDKAHNSTNIFINTTINSTGYKHHYDSNVTVTRPAFFDGQNDNDMKLIKVTITDSDTGKTLTSLRTYSANIGEVDFYKKAY